uniref:Interferon regulatory factor 8 n=1 Tax=Amazona collaria TaxID=241587 RepID=A0A8B9IXU9_9PSIT
MDCWLMVQRCLCRPYIPSGCPGVGLVSCLLQGGLFACVVCADLCCWGQPGGLGQPSMEGTGALASASDDGNKLFRKAGLEESLISTGVSEGLHLGITPEHAQRLCAPICDMCFGVSSFGGAAGTQHCWLVVLALTITERRMCDRNGGRRLRQWLIEQIDSELYPGLIWENEEKTMFRIPWKHAGKQDYNQEVDASIFKAWAVFKGKFKEGDKAEPATWKTRLRCALNKSPDFEEVTDRSQLDISEPYKVYRIVPEEEQKSKAGIANGSSLNDVTEMDCNSSAMDDLMKEPPCVDEYLGIIKRSPSPPQETCRNPPIPDWWVQQPSPALPLMNGYSSYEQHHSGYSQMVISFFYGGRLVGRITTSCSEGCRLSLSQPSSHGEKLYAPDALEHVRFPSADAIQNDRQKQITKKLFGHLERGVLLHSNKQGIFIKRLCQGRVFWSGNTMIYKDRPNKLDRDEVVKIFDTSSFFRELQQYYNNQGRFPDSRVMLCFGEEFPDAVPLRCKLILVQVEQLCVRQVVEEAGKTCSSSPMLPIADETQHDQVYRIFQDICATHQRPLFRENQQIAV